MLEADALTSHLERIARDGFTVVEGAIDLALADRLLAAIEVRQQENQQLGVPREIAKGFSPRRRKRVGYGIYRGLLGHIDKCSPADLLDGGPPRRVVGG
jgi:hypothetical protein